MKTLVLLPLVLLLVSCSKPAADQTSNGTPAAESLPPPVAEAEPDSPAIQRLARTKLTGDLDQLAKGRIIRVLAPFRRPEYFFFEGKPAGILVEAFGEFEKQLNVKYKTDASNRIHVALLPTPVADMADRMTSGFADIAAAALARSAELESKVDVSVPTYTGLKGILVTGPSAPKIDKLEDLSGNAVWVHPLSRFKGDLEAVNAKFKASGKAPVKIELADTNLDLPDILEMVNAGIYPATVMQDLPMTLWSQVFEGVKAHGDIVIADNLELVWGIRKGTPQLKAFADDFIRSHGLGTAFGNTLLRRYLKSPENVRNAVARDELAKFAATAGIFKKYSHQYDFDYLLMVAQGYQESRLDNKVKSPAGAVGIMQVKPETAAGPPIRIKNIQNVENNIHAGTMLVHYLINDYFDEPGLDPINKALFAFAAYNCGPARVRQCRRQAQEMGFDPNKWFGNVEVAVAHKVGIETTRYVANIYKYFVAYKMAAEVQSTKKAAITKARTNAN